MDRGRQERDEVDPIVVLSVRRQSGAPATLRAGIQLRELPPPSGATEGGGAVIADNATGEVDQDRGECGTTCPVCDFPDGGGSRVTRAFSCHPGTDTKVRGAPAEGSTDMTAANRLPSNERRVDLAINPGKPSPMALPSAVSRRITTRWEGDGAPQEARTALAGAGGRVESPERPVMVAGRSISGNPGLAGPGVEVGRKSNGKYRLMEVISWHRKTR